MKRCASFIALDHRMIVKIIAMVFVLLLPAMACATAESKQAHKSTKKVVHAVYKKNKSHAQSNKQKTQHTHRVVKQSKRSKAHSQAKRNSKKINISAFKKKSNATVDDALLASMPDVVPIEINEATMTNEKIQSLLDYAMSLEGVSYRFGGESPQTGFDCSGYVQHVFEHEFGILLPHNAAAISRTSNKISKAELRPGDLVLFNTLGRTFSHIGIYLGNHRFIHANSRKTGVIEVANLQSRYWAKRFTAARRLIST